MKIKATRNMLVGGEPVETGAELDVSDKVGRYLVLIGKAVEVEPADPTKAQRATDEAPVERATSKRVTKAEKAAK